MKNGSELPKAAPQIEASQFLSAIIGQDHFRKKNP
jgi:hypothetical protein